MTGSPQVYRLRARHRYSPVYACGKVTVHKDADNGHRGGVPMMELQVDAAKFFACNSVSGDVHSRFKCIDTSTGKKVCSSKDFKGRSVGRSGNSKNLDDVRALTEKANGPLDLRRGQGLKCDCLSRDSSSSHSIMSDGFAEKL